MRIGLQKQNTARRGNAIIEFALSATLLFTMLFGTFQFGYTFYVYNQLQASIRSGVRYASMRPYTLGGGASSCPGKIVDAVKNMVVYAQPTVPTGATSGFLGLTPAKVEVIVTNPGTEFGRINVSIINYDYFFFNPMIHRSFQNTKAVSESLPLE